MPDIRGVRARLGHQIGLIYYASAAPASVVGFVELEDGRTLSLGEITSFTTDGTQQEETGDKVLSSESTVTAAYIGTDAAGVRRGQFYAQLALVGLRPRVPLIRGYMYSSNDNLPLGFHEEALAEPGYLNWTQEANDAAGNIVTTINLAKVNVRRMIRAIIVKYHQVGGSAATITITLRDLADSGGPTNWSIASDTWVSPSLVLGANEEGLIHVGEHGFVSTNDAGTIAYADNTSAPNPFPFMVEDGETGDLIIAASGGASGDDYDVWVQYEEWIEV